MSAQYFTSKPQVDLPTTALNEIVLSIGSAISNYPGRSLFATRFSQEDQVLAHLIFKHKLPIRVFTYAESSDFDLLIRSVDFFKGNIEVSYSQARVAAEAFVEQHPFLAQEYEQNPAIAPLAQVLRGRRLLISSRRKEQLERNQTYPIQFEWDEPNQRAIFYPLFHWTEAQVQAYAAQFDLPLRPRAKPSTPSLVNTAEPSSIWRNVLRFISPKSQISTLKSSGEHIAAAFQPHLPRQASYGLLE